MGQDKVAFITGANRGIGFETARELAAKGVHVVIGARNEAKARAAAKKLSDLGMKADALEFDVKKRSDHAKAFELFERRFGKLDILINNAGVFLEAENASVARGNETSIVPEEILRETMEVNFYGPVALTQKLLPLIRKAPAGRIVNVSSLLSSLTLHSDKTSPIYDSKAFAYGTSKTALNCLTVYLAHELKDTNIKVNSADPGWVKTEMGGPSAFLELSEGGKVPAQLALLGENGPTGAFLHHEDQVPW